MSKRVRMALFILMLSLKDLFLSNMPDFGLADAMILARALSWHTIPPLATVTLCCYATYNTAALSAILSN